MGIQASTNKASAGKLAFEQRRKGTKVEKSKIGILAFEVSSAMSKCVQLWYSLSDQEIRRLTTEVIKSEGILNLVCCEETVLLNLACMEKLQDLTTLALSVSRLGKKCCEPALVGFEHIYHDILRQTIDVGELEYTQKEMDSKIKKMERYIASTSSLYQELEILSEMDQALKRLQEENDPAQKDNIDALEQKTAWQQQEIKYLKEISLWNRTYDKVVGFLARGVCTMYGKIIKVFGFPIVGWPEILLLPKNEGIDFSASFTSSPSPKLGHSDCNVDDSTCSHQHVESSVRLPSELEHSNNSIQPSLGNRPSRSNSVSSSNGHLNSIHPRNSESFMSSFCFSPGRQFYTQRSTSASYLSRSGESLGSSPIDITLHELNNRSRDNSGCLSRNGTNNGRTGLPFDPRCRLQDAPPSTLGGSALALHYSNVIIIAEKMARYPHLITQDARDDLYQMLPKNVRISLRGKLKACMRCCSSLGCECARVSEWKDVMEKLLGWLAPLAHNTIRWQSEHNFEQQQVVSRSNVLLLQTLYFADREKAESAIIELLVGLNYLWRHERDFKANLYMEYASNKDIDEYLEWQL